MESGEYYIAIETNEDSNFPRLILGYLFDGKRVEIYKSQETYVVVNTKTEKYLTCISYEHAHYVFEECVRTLAPETRA
jgi:GTP cyclohydrolase FolE2